MDGSADLRGWGIFDRRRPRHRRRLATWDPSNLLAYEAKFALGQMQDAEAVPALEAVLIDLSLHPIVRHEAAEALGAIGLEGIIPFWNKAWYRILLFKCRRRAN
ncbi:60S ribosomal protein L17-like [Iris pallida]|uniref:60S ribosomal protein L17-like n=1 Tax=Iris pallida TaxID=29817 RepID=A0AAX6FJ92_IRIPA|nr:60S ribosomal protein L17-like [Iris pallida]KAJ6828712.1 60S ribosomal protein L17-like [Iris pallida]